MPPETAKVKQNLPIVLNILYTMFLSFEYYHAYFPFQLLHELPLKLFFKGILLQEIG